MSRFCISTGPLAGRSWRSGHPFRPRCGRFRRVAMVLLLITFCAIIGAYNYVTNADRVRQMAEGYLSGLIGGRVTVHSATLSVFEGLRLEGVSVFVDNGHEPDSLLFSAQTFVLTYDPAKIIRGQLEAAQIVAQKPHVHLTENRQTHEWNFYRLGRGRPARPTPAPAPAPAAPPPLPEVLLRNARVEISELVDGQIVPVGYEAADGQISPVAEPGQFTFDLQTRGKEGIGPWARGRASIAGGPVDVEIHDFDLGRDVRSMLWDDPRVFWERHNGTGRIDTLQMHYQPARGARKRNFWAEMVFKDINADIPPEDWLSRDEIRRRSAMRDGVATMQSLYRLGGYRVEARPEPEELLGAESAEPPHARAATTSPVVSPEGQSLSASPADVVARMVGTQPFELRGGSGTFVFSDTGVEVKDVTGRVEGNAFMINAHLDGYNPEAPFSVTLQSLENETLKIPSMPRYITSLPPLVRDIYTLMQPDGQCTMGVKIERLTPGGRPLLDGHVDIVDGTFSTVFFPYPLRQMHGRIAFGYDAAAKADFVHVTDMHGRGLANGPNRDSWISFDANVGPLGPEFPDPQVVVHVRGSDVHSEPRLMAAFPPEVKEPLKIFDADKTGLFPTFDAEFSTTILHRPGWAWRWSFDTDLHLNDASGKLVGFPYFLNHIQADVHVRDGFCDIINAHARHGDTTLRVDGRVTWPPMPPPDAPPMKVKITTDVNVAVRNLPVDKELLAAIPADESIWLKRIGLGGKIDVDGRVYQGLPDPTRPGVEFGPDDVRFDLGIAVHDGTLWPADGTFSVSDLSGRAHLTSDFIELSDFHGRRGNGSMSGDGAIKWADGAPELALHVKTQGLPMDSGLYALLSADARGTWDQIHPEGSLDADMSFRAPLGELATTQPAPATTRPSETQPSAPPTYYSLLPPPQPAAFDAIPSGFHATLWPDGMRCTLDALPYPLDEVRGKISITPELVTIEDITARHGAATIAASGTGTFGARSVWKLKLSAHDLPVDAQLRHAMPPAILSVLNTVKLGGTVDFDSPEFIYRGEGLFSSAASQPATQASALAPASHPTSSPATPAPGVDIDMRSRVRFRNCTLNAAMPMKDLNGVLDVKAAVRNGAVSTLDGHLDVDSVRVSGRRMTNVKLDLSKPADRWELSFNKINANLAGGQVAGEVHLFLPDDGASRYVLSLVVRNCDIQTLVQDPTSDLKGDLTASLALEGSWDDPSLRRGRGDVLITGKELYHLPLLLGLFQVTDLALPLATPFTMGSARYSVEGQLLNFEKIELKSDNMLMVGGGHLDFKTKKLQMTFTTDNPNELKVAFLHDLLNNARGELMRINVRGTIQAPRVDVNPFGTFTTTIDEVFKGDPKSGK